MGNRYLYVVARTQPALYEELSNRFADDPQITVILDRRHDEQPPSSAEEAEQRRQRDRRRNSVAQGWLRAQSFAVVVLPT